MCPQGEDPAIEAYKAVRAHEITLNEAKAALERAVLAPLVALNGGAIAAFLTLLGALSGKTSTLNVDTTWAKVAITLAIVAWALGLFAAARAVVWASREQAAINKGYRLMREQVEQQIMSPNRSVSYIGPGGGLEVRNVPGIIAPPRDLKGPEPRLWNPGKWWEDKKSKLKPPDAPEKGRWEEKPKQKERQLERIYANFAGRSRERCWQASAAAFVIGALLALAGIAFSDKDNTKTSTTTTTTTTTSTRPGKSTTITTRTTTTTTPKQPTTTTQKQQGTSP